MGDGSLSSKQELARFRAEYGAWLDVHAPSQSLMAGDPPRSSGHLPRWAREWQRAQFDAGWLVPSWPSDLGGRNATAQQVLVCFEELGKRRIPRTTNVPGFATVAPAIVEHGALEQIKQYGVPMLRGEMSGCIGMSEPNVGSDLASIATRAVVEGDEYVIHGQKVWTSGAMDADVCLLFARTSTDGPKQAGITAFLLDMHVRGVTVRPIPQSFGRHHADFAEVYLDGARVAASAVLGELNGGWRIARASLEHERHAVWLDDANRNQELLELAIESLSRSVEGHVLRNDDAAVDRLVGLMIEVRGFVALGAQSATGDVDEEAATYDSLLKLIGTETRQRLQLFLTDMEGPTALELLPESLSIEGWRDGQATSFLRYLRTFDDTISGGTSEIQRNIVAERVLGLPRA